MSDVICDICGKTHHTVRKMFVLANWDGKQRVICSDCILDCVTSMIHHDREWFERQIEEIKCSSPENCLTHTIPCLISTAKIEKMGCPM